MSGNDENLTARIADLVSLSEKRGAVYTHFLNERQQFAAEAELKRLGCENYRFFGGVENADRRILCVFSEYCCPEDGDFPMSCVTFRYRPARGLSHRDLLGSMMSLNIKRETIGDILIGEGIAQAFVSDTVADAVLYEIKKIGSEGVRVSSDEPLRLGKGSSYREIKGTVASLRLDCVISMALGISRSNAAAAAASGAVEINYEPCCTGKKELSENDIFSVRGYGKYRLNEISGVSKKGRIHVSVLKYC